MIWPSSPAVKTVCSWSKTQKLRTSSDPWAPGSPTLVSALKPQAGDLAMWTSWKSCWLFVPKLWRQHHYFMQGNAADTKGQERVTNAKVNKK